MKQMLHALSGPKATLSVTHTLAGVVVPDRTRPNNVRVLWSGHPDVAMQAAADGFVKFTRRTEMVRQYELTDFGRMILEHNTEGPI